MYVNVIFYMNFACSLKITFKDICSHSLVLSLLFEKWFKKDNKKFVVIYNIMVKNWHAWLYTFSSDLLAVITKVCEI